jgi:uncharacterized protein YjbI with pentapeptide repeats
MDWNEDEAGARKITKSELLAGLRVGPAAWYNMRGNDPVWLRVTDEDFTGENLSDYNFGLIDFTGCRFFRAQLLRTSFSYSCIDDSDFSECVANEATFNSVQASGAKFVDSCLFDTRWNSANLRDVDFSLANLSLAHFSKADLSGAKLERCKMTSAFVYEADLSGTNLREAHLHFTNFYGSNFRGADLTRADLSGANLVKADFSAANLTSARVFGTSVWKTTVTDALQRDLIVSGLRESERIEVDNLHAAQFIHLLLSNRHVRDIVDAASAKVVLILGGFSKERKAILDDLRSGLRERNFVPIVFDDERPESRSLIETVKVLAGLSRLLIADVTDGRSVPHELSAIVSTLPSVPIQPILLAGKTAWATFESITGYRSVLPLFKYADGAHLQGSLDHLLAICQRYLDDFHAYKHSRM